MAGWPGPTEDFVFGSSALGRGAGNLIMHARSARFRFLSDFVRFRLSASVDLCVAGQGIHVALASELRRHRSREPAVTERRITGRRFVVEPVPSKKGTRMYPNSTRKRMTAVLAVLLSISISPAQAHAHGGGHGGGGHGGGGGHSSGGSSGGGFHLTSGSGGASTFGIRNSRFGVLDSGSYTTPNHLVVDSPGFPEDLPAARLHRFLEQHLLHHHVVRWLHG